MKLYDCAFAPSPRRVRIFLAEKAIAVPTVQVDLRNGEQFTPAFRAINPDCTVPVLELDDGSRIADAIAICLYFEATQPAPPLMGSDPKAKAAIAAAQRRAERDGQRLNDEAIALLRQWGEHILGFLLAAQTSSTSNGTRGKRRQRGHESVGVLSALGQPHVREERR